MKKLLIGAAVGWVIRGAYELVWLNKKTYAEVAEYKAELDNDWKDIREAFSEYRNSN